MAQGYRIWLGESGGGAMLSVKFPQPWYGSCGNPHERRPGVRIPTLYRLQAQLNGEVSGMDRALVLNNVKTLTRGNLGVPVMLMGLLGMMILPMPAFLLDVFFTFNISKT